MKAIKVITLIWVGAFFLALPSYSHAQESTSKGFEGDDVTTPGTAAPAPAPAAAPPAEQAPKKIEDLKLADFRCRGSDSLEGALTCAESLEDMITKRDEADEQGDDKGGRNMERLLKQAQSRIKSAVSKAFSRATDMETLSEVNDLVSEIIDTVEGSDTDLDKDLKDIANRMSKLAKQNIKAEEQVKYFDETLRPAYNTALSRYMDALNSGDPTRIAQAEKTLAGLDRYAQQSLNLLQAQNPTSDVMMFQTRFPEMAGSFELFTSRYRDLEMALQNNMSAFTTQAENLKSAANANKPDDGTRQTLPHPGEIRQVRNSGFPAIYSLPTYGSVADFYGNTNLTNNSDPFNTNSLVSNGFRTGNGRVSRAGASASGF